MEFPIISFDELFHVGTMNIEHKERESHEGSGLSVSTEPDAWITIAQLGGRGLFLLNKEHNQFLDFHELTDEQKEHIINWGISNQYIIKGSTYRVVFFDEDEQEVYMEFENYNDAFIEAEGYETEVIEIKDSILSTEKLKNRVMGKASPIMVLSLLATVFVEDVLKIDGVWWEDVLDVLSYSAPRGVIVPSMLNSWEVKLIEK